MHVPEIRWYYRTAPVKVPESWDLSRRHLRLETLNHKFVKLNKFENRINPLELRKYCVKYAPRHVYCSVLTWLFPERVGKKHKARYAYPVGGSYAVDIDSYLVQRHNIMHQCCRINGICKECINLSRKMALQLCEVIERYYREIHIVFSGRRGFHVWVQDFDLKDWTYYNERNPIKSNEVARLKFSSILAAQSYAFDNYHFPVSVDPMRILAVPNTLNAESGLTCQHIGDRKSLEDRSASDIVESSSLVSLLYTRSEPFKAMKLAARKNRG
jgi:hypothetical protein